MTRSATNAFETQKIKKIQKNNYSYSAVFAVNGDLSQHNLMHEALCMTLRRQDKSLNVFQTRDDASSFKTGTARS